MKEKKDAQINIKVTPTIKKHSEVLKGYGVDVPELIRQAAVKAITEAMAVIDKEVSA